LVGVGKHCDAGRVASNSTTNGCQDNWFHVTAQHASPTDCRILLIKRTAARILGRSCNNTSSSTRPSSKPFRRSHRESDGSRDRVGSGGWGTHLFSLDRWTTQMVYMVSNQEDE
jgi:hypothetical protein